MTISGTIFFGVLGFLFLSSGALVREYRKKWESVLSELADEIRAYNSRNDYGQQVLKIELARDFAIPLRGKKLEEFADANVVSVTTYTQELEENIGKPTIPLVGFVVQIISFVYIVSGLSYLIPGAAIPAIPFLIFGGILIAISFGLYVIV